MLKKPLVKNVVKWFVIAVVIAGVIFGMVRFGNNIFYDPQSRQAWVKPGIPQEEIPGGIDSPIAFENVTVIPMDSNRILEGQTVIIEDSHIVDIGTSGYIEIPADTHVVDGKGRFLIPGLSDMMTHTSGSENDLLVYLATGITTVRIMGNDPPEVLEWRDQIRAGTRVGPNMWVWWPQIQSHNFFSESELESATRGGKTWVHTPEEARQLVSEMAAKGVDGIKAHIVYPTDVYLAILETALEFGLPFDGHAPDDHVQRWLTATSVSKRMSDNWEDFRTMGVPALTHVEELIKMVDLLDENIRQPSDDSIKRIAQDVADDGMWITTTIHPFRTWGDLASDYEGTLSRMPEIKYLHPDVYVSWGWSGNQYVELGSRPTLPYYLAAQEKMLLALHEAGVPLMSGTDAAVPMMVPGFSLHDELETMTDIGLSPYEVLKTSTYNPALYLGELDEFGTIEKGKRADLVLLENNPLDDVNNTRQIAGTMVRGHWYSRADLNVILEKVAKNYEAIEPARSILKIVFWVVVGLLALAFIWYIVRMVRRRRSV